MCSSLSTRLLTPDDWRTWRMLRLAALGEAPHAFGAKLADWSGRGDTELRWRARLTRVSCNIVALQAHAPVGMVSAAANRDERVELLSMWVVPTQRGGGVADLLVREVVAWAGQQAAREVWLRMYESNAAALRCYLRNGFATRRRIEARSAGREGELLLVRSL